ncbi:MAG: hypothetical protein QOG05_2116 [Streptosporangiaceae bacterium]|jgi:hypothetical protein|nr:hypothetical protein [Streptosporangiaceae bacterium]
MNAVTHPWARSAVRGGLVAVGAVALAAAVEAVSYARWRPWCLTWGATGSEAAQAVPGDELLADAGIVSTRAVSVDAPPSSIWPWLVQMGPGRGGAYTYDWAENLMGLGMHSADEILPQYQDLKVGDAQRLGARGPVLRVAELEPERSLVFRSDDGNWVWAFSVVPNGTGSRLISRNRIATADASPLARALNTYLMEPGSLIMERKMLLSIKQRAEDLAKAS